MATREDLHRIVEEIPNSQLDTAASYLSYLRDLCDPIVKAFLDAPEDDEVETKEERHAVDEARTAFRHGEVASDEEVGQHLGR